MQLQYVIKCSLSLSLEFKLLKGRPVTNVTLFAALGFLRRPNGLSLAITVFCQMSHALNTVSHKGGQSMSFIASQYQFCL